MSAKEEIHATLRQALDADEQGDKIRAVELYSTAVELILKVSDTELRQKLNKHAVNALERAEELRGITAKPKDVSPNPSRMNAPRPQSKSKVLYAKFSDVNLTDF